MSTTVCSSTSPGDTDVTIGYVPARAHDRRTSELQNSGSPTPNLGDSREDSIQLTMTAAAHCPLWHAWARAFILGTSLLPSLPQPPRVWPIGAPPTCSLHFIIRKHTQRTPCAQSSDSFRRPLTEKARGRVSLKPVKVVATMSWRPIDSVELVMQLNEDVDVLSDVQGSPPTVTAVTSLHRNAHSKARNRWRLLKARTTMSRRVLYLLMVTPLIWNCVDYSYQNREAQKTQPYPHLPRENQRRLDLVHTEYHVQALVSLNFVRPASSPSKGSQFGSGPSLVVPEKEGTHRSVRIHRAALKTSSVRRRR